MRPDSVASFDGVLPADREKTSADREKNSETASPSELTLRAINGWRGPGALAIAFGHFAVVTDFFLYRSLQPIALVVDLFFVFSGVVIAQTYGARLRDPAAIPEYIIRRFGRIWPVQAATLSILVLYELAKLVLLTHFGKQSTSPPFAPDGPNFLAAVPSNLLLVQALGIHARETWNFPSWSLSVEFFTYIAFAAFCLLRPIQRYILSSATILVSVAILIFVAPLHMRSTFDFGFFRCLAGFFAGTLCYEAITRLPLPRWPVPTLVEIAIIALVGVWLAYAAGGHAAYAAPLIFSVFVAVFVAQRGAVSRLLSTKPFQFLAELSFSIYMVHAILLLFALAGLHILARAGLVSNFVNVPNPLVDDGARATVEVFHIGNPLVVAVAAIIYGAVVLGTAFLMYRYVEVPGRAYFARLAKSVRRKTMIPAGAALPATILPTNILPTDAIIAAAELVSPAPVPPA